MRELIKLLKLSCMRVRKLHKHITYVHSKDEGRLGRSWGSLGRSEGVFGPEAAPVWAQRLFARGGIVGAMIDELLKSLGLTHTIDYGVLVSAVGSENRVPGQAV